MQTDFLDRIKRELSISADGVRETILTIADRVNRKRQAVKLHWQASEAGRQIALQQQRLGGMIAEVLGEGETGWRMRGGAERSNLHVTLQEVSGAIKVLREEQRRIDRLIAELESEALADDLLQLQQDLSSRALKLERLVVVREAPVVGVRCDQLTLTAGTRVLGVFRGPMHVSDLAAATLREGDIVILVGPAETLRENRELFTQRHRASA